MLKALKRVESFLFFLTILFLPTQLGRHFWPSFSQIYSLRIDYLSPTIYFWDLLVICLLGIFIIQRKKVNFLALNLVLIFILTQLPSLFNASNLGAGLVRVEQYVTTSLFGVYLASQNWEVLKKQITIPLAVALIGESFLAISQVLKGGSIGFWILGERTFSISTPAIAKFDFESMQLLRPYATFSHPNILAAFLLIGGMIIWTLGEGVKKKMLVFMAFITILLTFSRTAILGAIFSSLFFLRKKGIILMIFLLVVVSPILFTRFFSILNFDNLSVLRREELAKGAIELFSKNPLFGVGLNNFIPSLSSDLISGPNRFLQPVHNIFLLALSETGLIGLVGLLILLGFPIFKLLKLHPKPYPLNTILLIWVVILFLGMFDHYFLTLPQGIRIVFLVWGLTMVLK